MSLFLYFSFSCQRFRTVVVIRRR